MCLKFNGSLSVHPLSTSSPEESIIENLTSSLTTFKYVSNMLNFMFILALYV